MAGFLDIAGYSDDYYKNMANNAMVQGQQMENIKQAQQAEAARQAQMAANAENQANRIAAISLGIPEYDPQSIQMAQRLINAKALYENAADDAGRANAASIGTAIRDYADKHGISLEGFGADVSRDQAQTQLDMMRQTLQNNLMSMETPDEFYTRRRNEYITNGASEKDAIERAGREAQEYQAKFAHAYNRAFLDGGTKNNAINDEGVYLIAELMNTNPQAAAAYSQFYAHPVDNYNLDAWTQKAIATADLADRSSVLRNNLSMARDNNNFNNQRVMNSEEFERQLQGAKYNNDLKKDMTLFMNGLDQQKQNEMIQLAQQYPELAAFIYEGKPSSGGRSGGAGNSQEKMNASQQKTVQAIANLIEAATEDINDESLTAEQDGENLDALWKFYQEASNNGELDHDMREKIKSIHYELNQARQKKHGYDS